MGLNMGIRNSIKEVNLVLMGQLRPAIGQARNRSPHKQKLLVLVGVLFVFLSSSLVAFSANVTVNVTSNLFPVASTAYGMHTSVYDNQNGNSALPGLLMESGVNTLRYPGGGYADVFHWSVNKLTPWFGMSGDYGYQGPNTDFGSFVGLLSSAQCQAIITINFGSGQLWNAGHTQLVSPSTNAEPPEAAAWVAYANGDASLFGTINDIALGTDSQGNNWRTAGFWAKLRSSSPSIYQTWATAAGVYDATFSFLAINRPTPVGIKYWEIGNETFGTGYYPNTTGNGYSVNYAVPYPSTNHTRLYNPALSPATYGQQVKAFSLAMKAVDPTIKIGAVVSTPLGDYSWDVDNLGQHWTPQVLSQCASNIDFIIAHWYFYNGNNDNGNSLLPAPAANIPSMINGTGSHTGTSSGLKDWINQYRPGDPTNVSIFITEFGYTGSLATSASGKPIIGPVTMLFDVDSYSSWMSLGVSNICFLEMNKTGFLGDSAPLTRGETFYGIKLLHQMAQPGDMIVSSTSDTSTIKVKATRQQNGNVGLLLLNESLSSTQTVNVAISNTLLLTTGTQFIFGQGNFITTQELPTSAPSSNSVSGVGNSFSVAVPPYTMMVYTIPMLTGTTPTTLSLISITNPSTYGNPITFTATVKTNGVALNSITGETITFYNGSTQLGTGSLKGNGNASLITANTQLAAGTGSITAVYGGDAFYIASSNSPALLQVVNQATLTAGLTGAVTKNYDGTSNATLTAINYTLSGIVSGDTVTLNNPTSGTYDNRNQGAGMTVTVTGLSISGASSANYFLASTSISAAIGTINVTNITVTAAADSKFYDGTTTSPTLPIITSGSVQSGDSASFIQSYTDPNVGVGKTLISSGTVSDGNGGNNYTYTFISGTDGAISAATASIVSGVAANSKVYDGTTAATLNFTNVVLGGILPADAGNVNLFTNGYTAVFVSPDAGTAISVTVGGLSLVGSAAVNYTLIQPTGLNANIMSPVTVTGITVESGTVQVTFYGVSGQAYRVLASSDVTLPIDEWSVLTNGTLGSDPVTFTESVAPGTQSRFYRIAAP
jgi:hypothetical protein